MFKFNFILSEIEGRNTHHLILQNSNQVFCWHVKNDSPALRLDAYL